MVLTANAVRKLSRLSLFQKGRLRLHLTAKTLLIMKLTAIFLLAACLAASATGKTQTVTLSVKNAPLQDVFLEIKKQTGYTFIYTESLLQEAKKVSLRVKNSPLDETLRACFMEQPFAYTIIEKTIIVKPKEELASRTDVGMPNAPVPFPIRVQVADADNNPLAGATVSINKKPAGKTDAEGVLSLNVSVGDVLSVSFVGYASESITISSQSSTLSIVLKRNDSSLNEVVINKGYYTEKQKFSVGNVTKVTAAEIEKQPVNNPLLALEGRVSGLFITQQSGMSGSGVIVRIQGQNSITKGNNPLYVVDGVPLVTTIPTTGIDGVLGSDGAGGVGSPLSYLNPADIESIEVLKDADATSIYGSRAANGALLITTKKGKVGKTKFDLNMQQGWGKVIRKMDMMNTQEYLQMRHEAFNNDNLTPGSGDYDINGTWDSTRYTDLQKTLIGNTTQYTNINTSISGGTPYLQYLLGGTYHRETTVFPVSNDFCDRKGSVHLNLNGVSTNQKFHLQLSSTYLIDNNQLPRVDLTPFAILTEPDAPALYNPDGTLNWAPDGNGSSTVDNPLQYKYIKYKANTTNFINNVILNYLIVPGLEIKSSFGYTVMETTDYVPFPLIARKPEDQPNSQRGASYGKRNLNTWLIEPQIVYNKKIGKGIFNGLVGTTILQNNNSSSSLVARGFSNDAILEDISASTQISPNTSDITEYKYTALFGRLNYNWQEKYILNLTARRDGSSRFGSKNQFHNFGSAGAAWIFSQERFLQNVGFLSFGKLRISYGTSGNDQIGDYQFLNIYRRPSFASGVAYQAVPALYPRGLSNPYLEWEETRKVQGGVDLGFLKDRIMINATYSLNRSSNQLLSYALPSTTGFLSITKNFPATVQNTSWEFSFQTTNVKAKLFTWTSNLNLTIPKNKLIKFPDLATSTYGSYLIIGQPVSIIKAIHFLGVDPTSGKYQFADSKGIPTLSPSYPDDYNSLINTLPKFYGGVQNHLEYGAFQVDFLLQFVKQKGALILFTNGVIPPGAFASGISNQPAKFLNRWQKQGDNSLVRQYTTDFFPDDVINVINSDGVYGDASYLRLKNLSVSWDLPNTWKRAAHLQNCRIYMQGQNLWTITNYQGLDPENQSIFSLPPLSVFTLGIQVGF
ncbi:MAG: SusC/RagA family TonB-linked outer membrane protein [Chitinophagaceae bacterium]